jgi:E3 ubiquitin-protein ligase makorin
MERLLFGAGYDSGSDPLPSPPWPVSEAEARTLMEIILEGGDPPEWDEFEEEEEDDEDDEDYFYEDVDDPFDPNWEQSILDTMEFSAPPRFNSRSRWAQGTGAGDQDDVFLF